LKRSSQADYHNVPSEGIRDGKQYGGGDWFESGTVKATGKAFRNEWTQKYVVQNGVITEMEEYNIQLKPAT
jgi:hypothetical protein